jgi:hypothetical protein
MNKTGLLCTSHWVAGLCRPTFRLILHSLTQTQLPSHPDNLPALQLLSVDTQTDPETGTLLGRLPLALPSTFLSLAHKVNPLDISANYWWWSVHDKWIPFRWHEHVLFVHSYTLGCTFVQCWFFVLYCRIGYNPGGRSCRLIRQPDRN